jgi:cobalt-zinc-cadmium efflux system protein
VAHYHHHQHVADNGHPPEALEVRGRALATGVALTLVFVAVEALFGWFGRSLALLSDAGHNLADAAALGFSWYAVRIAERPSHEDMTYGYHRMGVLAALANAASLAVIALVIAWEAFARVRHPEVPNATVMIVVAAMADVVNTAIGLRLHAHASHDINVRSAYLHMVGDGVSALALLSPASLSRRRARCSRTRSSRCSSQA